MEPTVYRLSGLMAATVMLAALCNMLPTAPLRYAAAILLFALAREMATCKRCMIGRRDQLVSESSSQRS